jgi:hypothetical protein
MDNMGRNTKIFIHRADVSFYHNNFAVSTNSKASTFGEDYFSYSYSGKSASFGKLNETSISPFLTKTTNAFGSNYEIADKIIVFKQPCVVSYIRGDILLDRVYG